MPLLEQTNSYDLIYKWFDYLKQQNHRIAGYVIMPNHIHVLIDFVTSTKKINTIIGDGKRFASLPSVLSTFIGDVSDSFVGGFVALAVHQ